MLIDPEVITGGYHIGIETLWREVLSMVHLSEDERSCILRAYAPDVEDFVGRTFWPKLPEEQDIEALGCLVPETFANIYLSLIMTEYAVTDEHVECLRGLFSVTDFSVIIAAMLPEGYDANEVEVEGFWDGFLVCVPEELLNEGSDDPTPPTERPVLIDPEVITGGYHMGVETLWQEVLSKVPLSEDERSCVLGAFAPDVEGFVDRTFWPELPEEQDIEALGCLAPETFANIYLSLITTEYPLTGEHVECLRGLFSVTDFSVIIAAMLPEGYDANQVEIEGFWDGFLACVPEEVLDERLDDPTTTPVPSPEPTPTRTPMASPTSVSMPDQPSSPATTQVASYLTDEIPPCTPVPGSATDPCEPDVSRVSGAAMEDLGLEPWSVRFYLDGGRGRILVGHLVVRGTYLPGTVRCIGVVEPFRYPAYTNQGLITNSPVKCYSDLRVNAYILGSGPSALTVLVKEFHHGLAEEHVEELRSSVERVLIEGGDHPFAEVPAGGITGREAVLFLGPAVDTSVEAWEVFQIWDVQRRQDGTVVAVHPHRDYWRLDYPDTDYLTYRSVLEMELPAFAHAVSTANQARITEYEGRTGPEQRFPTLVTDANRLRQYFSDPKVGAYAPGVPAPAQPPPPCGLAVPDQADNPGLMRDCINLLAAVNTLRGTATLNWSFETPITDWDGVWVQGSPGRVTGLILTSQNLDGTVPPELGRLDALEHLRLNENRLTGELPAELGNLRDLRSLLLNDNQLTGEIPTELGRLDNLWHLQLANNQFGCIPSSIRYVDTNDPYDLRLPSCDPSDDRPTFQRREDRYTGHDCLDRYDINFVGGATWWMSPLPEIGSGVLEQRVLDNDLVVIGQVLSVNPEVVTVDSVKSRLLDPTDYDGFERTLLIEVHLRVQEYLKGHGPDEITVVIEGQSVFNTEEEGTCAKAAFAHVHGRLIESQEGIALMTQTSEPGFYHLGYADAIIAGTHSEHGTWLASDSGKFYDATREEWIGIDEARQRISSVIEDYDRRDDEKWQNCVYYKHWSKGRDPWRYRGVRWSFRHYRDHDIIFNGGRVPVPAGTTIWSYADYHGLKSESRLRLLGKDADLFEVAYHSEYEKTYNEWDATIGGHDHRLAIWYLLPDGIREQWRHSVSGYVIKAVEDLSEGEYQFYLLVEDQSEDYVYCGQPHPEPNRFRIFVDEDRPTVPPAPTSVKILDDPEGWIIVWDPRDGVDEYDVYVFRPDENGVNYRTYVGEDTDAPGYRIRFDELNGCDDLVYVRITPHGDGETYLKDFGVPIEPIELRTNPCEP